ncbi:unnamed protein product [Lathyrus oleraceus]
MEEKPKWLKPDLEFFNIHSSPSSDSNSSDSYNSFVSVKNEGCESPISWNSKSESDKSLSLLGEENCLDMK